MERDKEKNRDKEKDRDRNRYSEKETEEEKKRAKEKERQREKQKRTNEKRMHERQKLIAERLETLNTLIRKETSNLRGCQYIPSKKVIKMKICQRLIYILLTRKLPKCY